MVLSLVFLCSLAACSTPEQGTLLSATPTTAAPTGTPPSIPTGPEEPTLPPLTIQSAVEAYEAAKLALHASSNRVMSYTITQSHTSTDQTYTESASGTASFCNFGAENMVAVIKEKVRYGKVSAEHLLQFSGGQAYSTISNSTFSTGISAEDFAAQQLPVALLNPNLYSSITPVSTADSYELSFTNPTLLESWVSAPEGVQLISASGIASLDANGTLLQTTYTATYTNGSVSFFLNVIMRCTAPEQLALSVELPAVYTPLSCLETPRILLRTVGNIFSAKQISADITETIFGEVIPLTQQRQTHIDISGSSDSMTALLTNTITVRDYRDQPIVTTREDRFTGDGCFVTINGSEPEYQEGVTAQDIRTQVEDSILAALLATKYISEATLTEEEDVYRLDFVGNETYCYHLTQYLCSILDFSLEGATSYHSTEAGGYLCIDKITGLPVAMGVFFSRTHMFGTIPYELSYQLDQTLTLSPTE